ncbi:hypothetical protein ASF28_02440 [Methylobacterium sp. Leaf99]|nr:hypothetical protein ASF28_02440 [Methylobacterium sp. Leaf99]
MWISSTSSSSMTPCAMSRSPAAPHCFMESPPMCRPVNVRIRPETDTSAITSSDPQGVCTSTVKIGSSLLA